MNRCILCQSCYFPSETSDPSLCGLCISLSYSHRKHTSDLNNKVRGKYLYDVKTPQKAKTHPKSWGMPLTGNACQCSRCDEVFNSVSSFDKHQFDSYRKCLTPGGMRGKGMSINNRGRWISKEFNFDSVQLHVNEGAVA